MLHPAQIKLNYRATTIALQLSRSTQLVILLKFFYLTQHERKFDRWPIPINAQPATLLLVWYLVAIILVQ